MKRKMNRILASSMTLLLLLLCFANPFASFAEPESESRETGAVPAETIGSVPAAGIYGIGMSDVAIVEDISGIDEVTELPEKESRESSGGVPAVSSSGDMLSTAGEVYFPQEKEISEIEEVIEDPFIGEDAAESAEEEIYINEETGLILGNFAAPAVKKKSGLLKASGDGTVKYILRDEYGEAKNQGPDNICWAYSTVALAEHGLKKKDGPYSERGLAYFMYNSPSAADPLGLITGDGNTIKASGKDFLSLGGNPYYAIMMLSGWEGVQTNAVINGSSAPAAELAFQNDAVLEEALIYNLSANPELVKEAIKKYGGVTVEYHAGERPEYIATNSTYVRYNHEEAAADHSVTVVGWDDSFDRKYFAEKDGDPVPSKNGAWLVRNSWGSEFGDDGYFWLSYEDRSLGTNAAAMSFVPASKYDHNYHYDGSAGYHTNVFEADGVTKGTLVSGGSVGNIFKATGHPQEVRAVNVGFASAEVDYSVEIYRNRNQMTNPTDGVKVGDAVTGKTSASGLYCINLPAPAYIPKDYYFSVVVTVSVSDTSQAIQLYTDQNINYNYSSGDTYLYCQNTTSEGQSFVKTGSSSKWADWYKTAHKSWTVRIKALTKECEEKTIPLTGATASSPMTVGVGTTAAIKYQTMPDDATVKSVTFVSSDPSVVAADGNGNITGVKAGEATVTVNASDGINVKSAQVQVKVVQYPTSIYFAKEEKKIKKGGTLTVTLAMKPSGAVADGLTFIWSSTDTSVCKIKSSSGIQAVLSGVEEDECEVRVYCKEYPSLKATCYVSVYKSSSSGGGSGGGGGGGGGTGPGKAGQTGTFSSYWYQEGNGDWKIKDKTGKVVTTAWLCDDAITANGQNVWYLLDNNGKMMTGGLVQDKTGNFYSLEMNHNGYYGMLRYKNGVYDGIYMEFSQNHDGTFGKLLNQSAIDALEAKYGVTTFGVGNENCTYTSKF